MRKFLGQVHLFPLHVHLFPRSLGLIVHLLDIIDGVRCLPYSHVDGLIFLDLVNELLGTAKIFSIQTFQVQTSPLSS